MQSRENVARLPICPLHGGCGSGAPLCRETRSKQIRSEAAKAERKMYE